MRPQIFIGSRPDPAKFQRVRNGDGDYHPSCKGIGGIWTAPTNLDGISAWMPVISKGITSTYLASHPVLEAWRVYPQKDAAGVWTITGVTDLRHLISNYGRTVKLSLQKTPRDYYLVQEWQKERGAGLQKMPRICQVIDFERMARDGWDAIDLTPAGYHATRTSDPHLYGWDCPCVYWIGGTGWPFRAVEPAIMISKEVMA